MIALWLLACAEVAEERQAHAGRGGRDSSEVSDTGDSAADDTAAEDTGGPCSPEMALVGESVCVDRWEATIEGESPYEVPSGGVAVSEAGVSPQGYISGEVAAVVCAAAGKRLCSLDEWMLACAGAEGRTWPYGDTYDLYACNDTYSGGHPVVDYFGTSEGVWDTEHMNDPGINQQPGTVAETGEFEGCVTPEGIHDLHGNLHEWVSTPDGTFKGGFYADASMNGAGCSYTTTAHAFSYHDYSTGFRCCGDPRR
ncbi:hypothetical protein LBMAG42_44770 [Deltaproteobacteria bacterium]|nr:hypothetical protein LBMAG42_44770 [Deltaproteobacteria bacterium]